MTKTDQNVLGCQVTSYTLLGYRHVGSGSSREDWCAVYEVTTNQGTKYLQVNSDGYCGTRWHESKPQTIQDTPPTYFTADPWTRHRRLK